MAVVGTNVGYQIFLIEEPYWALDQVRPSAAAAQNGDRHHAESNEFRQTNEWIHLQQLPGIFTLPTMGKAEGPTTMGSRDVPSRDYGVYSRMLTAAHPGEMAKADLSS